MSNPNPKPNPNPNPNPIEVLLARLLTRPGMQPKLREFVQWGAAKLAEREAGGEGHDEIKSSFLMAGP